MCSSALTYQVKTKPPTKVILVGRLGQCSNAFLGLSFDHAFLSTFSMFYDFNYNDINIYEKRDRKYNVTYRSHAAEIKYVKTIKRTVALGLGGRFEHYNYNDVLSSNNDITNYDLHNQCLISYYGSITVDTQNDHIFPRKGFILNLKANLYTDNGYNYNEEDPFLTISGIWKWAISPWRKIGRAHV